VTCDAERNQVCVRIIATLAAKFLVVNLQIRPSPTTLASPTVTPPHLMPELFVQLRIEAPARAFGKNSFHEAFAVTSCRKACRCSLGKNLKNRDMSGL
jgi:hypothetical protein